MNNNFKKAFAKAMQKGKVIFSRQSKNKPEKLHTVIYERNPQECYFVFQVTGYSGLYFIKPRNETKQAVTYEVAAGKEGAAIFTIGQVKQFQKDFPNINNLKVLPLDDFFKLENQ